VSNQHSDISRRTNLFRLTRPQATLLALVSSIGLLGAGVLAISTPWGIGITPDSVVYVAAARSLLNGTGFALPSASSEFIPVVQYPPLFPLCLAMLAVIGFDPIDAAKWLNVGFLFAANVVLAGLIVYGETRSRAASIVGSFLVALAFPLVQAHTLAWAEPLFLFCTFFGLWLLARHIEAPEPRVLLASSILVSLGLLSRYAGAATVLTGVVAVLLFCRAPLKDRIFDAVLFIIGSCSLVSLWMFRNVAVAGTATARSMSWHPPSSEHLNSAKETILSWILPVGTSAGWASIGSAVALTIVFLFMTRAHDERDATQPPSPFAFVLALFIANYALLLFITVSFLDAHTPFNNRIFSPAFLSSLMLIVCLSVRWLRRSRSAALARIAVAPALLLFFITHFERSARWLETSYTSGFGYAGPAWRDSNVMKRLSALDASTPIFTNGPDAVYAITGRHAAMIPAKVSPATRLAAASFPAELAEMGTKLASGTGVLVYFHTVSWRWYLPSEEELLSSLNLTVVAREEEGAIYKVRN
jgi:hypothetical protein